MNLNELYWEQTDYSIGLVVVEELRGFGCEMLMKEREGKGNRGSCCLVDYGL